MWKSSRSIVAAFSRTKFTSLYNLLMCFWPIAEIRLDLLWSTDVQTASGGTLT